MTHPKSLAVACLLLIATTVALPVHADDKVPAADMAFQVIGRIQVTGVTAPGAGSAFTMAYFANINGIPDSLFAGTGAVNEANAYFTLRSESFTFYTIDNGNTKIRFRSPDVPVHVYYNPTPHGDFTAPDTLSSGQLIATFRVTSSMATKVDNVASDVTTSELVSSKDFQFKGHKYNFKQLIKNGVTQISTAPGTPVGDTGILATQSSFSGTAISIGDAGK